MASVRDYLSAQSIDDLWAAGFTVVARQRGADPFEVDPRIIPQGRGYQWMHLVHDRAMFENGSGGWAPVPASRHDGLFMPAGHVGDIEVSGLGLFEKPKHEIDAERASQVSAAHKMVDDWKEKVSGGGFTGHVVEATQTSIGKLDTAKVTEFGHNKTIENTSSVPMDMLHLMSDVFAERDRLKDAVVLPDRTLVPGEIADELYRKMQEPGREWWPTLNAILLPIAVRNVRSKNLSTGEKND